MSPASACCLLPSLVVGIVVKAFKLLCLNLLHLLLLLTWILCTAFDHDLLLDFQSTLSLVMRPNFIYVELSFLINLGYSETFPLPKSECLVLTFGLKI